MGVLVKDRIEITVGFPWKGRRERAFLQAAERGLLRGAEASIPQIQRFTPVFSGGLNRSYQIRFKGRPKRYIVESFLKEQAAVMEFGRHPNRRRPPMSAILPWVARKARALVKRFGLKSAAFIVARSIGKKGIKVFAGTGLKNNQGKGAMFRRTVKKLGRRFFSRHVGRAILEANLR